MLKFLKNWKCLTIDGTFIIDVREIEDSLFIDPSFPSPSNNRRHKSCVITFSNSVGIQIPPSYDDEADEARRELVSLFRKETLKMMKIGDEEVIDLGDEYRENNRNFYNDVLVDGDMEESSMEEWTNVGPSIDFIKLEFSQQVERPKEPNQVSFEPLDRLSQVLDENND